MTSQTRNIRRGASAFLALVLLAVSGTGGVSADLADERFVPDPDVQESLVVPTSSHTFPPTDGEVFDAPGCNYVYQHDGSTRSRPSLRVGINDFGTIGMGPNNPGDGFQMPIGTANENLAIGWWGEEWLIDWTLGGTSFHSPSFGPSGPITRIDDFYLDSSRYTTYRVTLDVRGEGGVLLVDFEWTLDKERCDLTLRTTMENQSDLTIDVRYKRIVDWDNLDSAAPGSTGGVYTADWSEDGRTATATRSIGGVPHYECRTTTLGSYLPVLIDLYAWDDLTTPGAGFVVSGSFTGDGNAGFHFLRNGLPPGGTWTTFLRYECEFLSPGLVVGPIDHLPVE